MIPIQLRYRPPPMSSGRGPRRAAMKDGAMSSDAVLAYDPGVISESYWAHYGKQTVGAIVAAAIGIAVFIGLHFHSETGAAFAPLMLVLGLSCLVLPVIFWRRHRALRRAFATDPGESAGTEAAVDLRAAYPHVGFFTDRSYSLLLGVLLLVGATLLLGGGIALVASNRPPWSEVQLLGWRWFGLVLLVEAPVAGVLAVFALREQLRTIRWPLTLVATSLGVSLLTMHWLAIGAHVVLGGLIAGSGLALERINRRIAEPTKHDPLVAYYHNLVAMLVWVMRADGHVDRRERLRIERICDRMQLSSYEQQFVVGAMDAAPREELTRAVDNFREAAEALGRSDRLVDALICALAVAGADGVIAEEEAEAIVGLGEALGIDVHEQTALLRAKVESLDEIDERRAAALLGLEVGASPEAIEAAYQTLVADLIAQEFRHIGARLSDHVMRKRAAVEQAHRVLTGTTVEASAPPKKGADDGAARDSARA